MAIIGSLPYTISDGQAIDAVPVQGNFNYIVSQVNSNATTTAAVTAAIGAALVSYAPLVSPAFNGTPTAPTAALGDSTDQVATTAFATAIGIGTNATGYAAKSGAAAGTPYTNSTNGPKVVSIQITCFSAGDGAYFDTGGINISQVVSYGTAALSLGGIVPAGASYELNLFGSAVLAHWFEW